MNYKVLIETPKKTLEFSYSTLLDAVTAFEKLIEGYKGTFELDKEVEGTTFAIECYPKEGLK